MATSAGTGTCEQIEHSLKTCAFLAGLWLAFDLREMFDRQQQVDGLSGAVSADHVVKSHADHGLAYAIRRAFDALEVVTKEDVVVEIERFEKHTPDNRRQGG